MKGKAIFIGVGLLFIIIGFIIYTKDKELKKNCTEEVVGTVINIVEEETTDEDGYSVTYYPVIEYTANNKVISKQSSFGSNDRKYEVNDKIEILYNPNKPEEYIIKGDNFSLLFIIIFPLLGAILTIAGIVIPADKIQST